MFSFFFFFFNDTATTEIYTLSLHDALPISGAHVPLVEGPADRVVLLAEAGQVSMRSEEHTSELQSLRHLVCRLLLAKKKVCKTRAWGCLPLQWRVAGKNGVGRAGAVFFFNDTATTEIYTLSLHDALPIY